MRIRFSLKSIIGIMTILGLALGWWNSNRSYAKMGQRYTLLFMDWVQPLEVKEPDLIYHRKLKMNEASLHHWKVYLPQGKRYDLECVVPCTLDMPGDELEYVAARIPMPEGQSIIEVEWRRDAKRKPHMSIARLGTTPETTSKEYAHFPASFDRNFLKNWGCTEHVIGWLASNSSFVVPRLTFVEGSIVFDEPFRTRRGPRVGINGFHVRLRAVGDATTAATNTPSTTKGVDTKAPASPAGKD
jgi:hypothetical protein